MSLRAGEGRPLLAVVLVGELSESCEPAAAAEGRPAAAVVDEGNVQPVDGVGAGREKTSGACVLGACAPRELLVPCAPLACGAVDTPLEASSGRNALPPPLPLVPLVVAVVAVPLVPLRPPAPAGFVLTNRKR